jgi:hypothetical protein
MGRFLTDVDVKSQSLRTSAENIAIISRLGEEYGEEGKI